MNQALNNLLIDAAAKAMSRKRESQPLDSVKKADPQKYYAAYDLSLGEFYVPGRTQRQAASEEQKMLTGFKLLSEKLQKENEAIRKQAVEDKVKAHEAGLKEGHQKGFAEGYAKGEADLQSSVNRVQQNITSVLKAFEAQKEALLSKSERKTLEIIFLAVERILHTEAKTRPELVQNVLKAALTEIAKTDTLRIKVNPAEAESVNASKQFWLPVNSQIHEVKIEEDSRVERGGCVVESAAGSVDARLSTQLEKIREIFLKCWEDGVGAVL